MNAQSWIEQLGLTPHPEGGFFAETYRASFQVGSPAGRMTGACTSIHYLLQDADFSGFHRLGYPELWYFHAGSPLHIHCIDDAGNYSLHTLGGDGSGSSLSLAIEPGIWFAAELPSKSGFSLVSCAVAPAFDFSVFEMAKREEMLKEFPQHAEILQRLCRD